MTSIDKGPDLGQACNDMLASASEVIAIRTCQFLTGRMGASDVLGLVAEKAVAATMSMTGGYFAAVFTGSPLAVGRAMLAPYESKVASNVGRLRG